jgi:hypothetical protein
MIRTTVNAERGGWQAQFHKVERTIYEGRAGHTRNSADNAQGAFMVVNAEAVGSDNQDVNHSYPDWRYRYRSRALVQAAFST